VVGGGLTAPHPGTGLLYQTEPVDVRKQCYFSVQINPVSLLGCSNLLITLAGLNLEILGSKCT
jgi:hypothetical protein